MFDMRNFSIRIRLEDEICLQTTNVSRIEQDNENIVIMRLFIEKERTMRPRKDKSTFDLCSLIECRFYFCSPIVEMFKLSLTSLCFNALLSNAAPSSLILFTSKSSIVHCFC